MDVPVPSAPTVSMKYSAATTSEFPVVESLILAVKVTESAPLVGSGSADMPDVLGPSVSSPDGGAALLALTKPKPYKLSLPVSPRSSAVACKIALTSLFVHTPSPLVSYVPSLFASRAVSSGVASISAAVPLTCGHAIDVPSIVVYVSFQ
ncbi:MAG: hypothetical protein C5S49_01735 [Candidatus Methanogaster sp.]|nr:MAG: hypothetical protein C5S49_01735 [ANME-2 cluster archaeon]